MIDQLIIGDKASFDDYGASISKRNIGMPKKKSIKETVPYSNDTYDFSAINGELYWEERKLEYEFEITADEPEELEEMKAAFSAWVMNIQEAKICDPFIPDYYFIGTFDDIKPEDDAGLDKTTITVTFTAYPYKISRLPKAYVFEVNGGATNDVYIINNSAHRVAPLVKASGDVIIKRETETLRESWAISASDIAGEITDMGTGTVFMLPQGVTALKLENITAGKITVEFSFFEEVL